MTPIRHLIRRWKILMALTLILMAVTTALMCWRFSPIQVVMLITQAILLVTQFSFFRMLKEQAA
jgi:hypothetical protein